jgi:hypothetical protein
MTTERPTTVATGASEGQSNEPLWSLADLAVFLKASKSTARRRIREGLPSKKIGGQKRFVPSEVREWVRRQEEDAA